MNNDLVEEAQAAQSVADFVAKMNIGLKEARESRYWLPILIEAELLPAQCLPEITNETEEIIKILFSIIQKAKQRFKTT
jgi:four helix bundle protein